MWREAQDCLVSMFPGFMYARLHCPECGHEWNGVAAVGMTGVACPACGFRDRDFVWRAPADHFSRAMPHDGCWLTGEFPLQMEVRPFRAEDINAAFDKDVKPLFPLTWRQRIMVRLLNWLIGKLVEVR